MITTNVANRISKHSSFNKGREVWRENLRLTALAADRVRNSFGPNGAYKMVTYHRGPEKIIKITKDAVQVLEELAVQQPTLAVLMEAARMQRQEVGDGVTSFVLLASALLRNADELITKKVHPNIILDGYLEAAKRALKVIEETSTKLKDDNFEIVLETIDCGRDILIAPLRQSLIEASKIVTKERKMEKNRIRIIRKQGAQTSETQLVKGVIIKKAKLHKNMPNNINNPRIAVTSGRIGTNRVEVKMPSEGRFLMKLDIQSPKQLNLCQEAERDLKRLALDNLAELGVNVLFCQQPIDSFSKCRLLDREILAFESVDIEDCKLIAVGTGAKMIGSLTDISEADVGTAERLTIEKLNPDEIVTLAVPEYATFLLRGATPQALDELELLTRNSMTILKTAVEESNVVPSCGATEMHIAKELRSLALEFSGRKQLAINGFEEALKEIPRCLADNAGANSDDILSELTKSHAEGRLDYGIRIDGSCGSVLQELSHTKSAAIKRAYEYVSLMLRVDEQITRKEIVKFHKKQ